MCGIAMVGCNSATKVARIGSEIVDPTGVKTAISVGDPSLKVRIDMGQPDQTIVSRTKRMDAMVYRRSGAEGVVVTDLRTKKVLKVLTADNGWMTAERLDQIEREIGSI